MKQLRSFAMAVSFALAGLPLSAAAISSDGSIAPEKPIRILMSGDRRLEESFNRAENLLSAGRVEEALEQFGIVAKLAQEPLRSRAMLKFGFAASILEQPGARGALTHAAQTAVADPEGREIRSFAQRVLESSEKSQLLTAPPKSSSKFFPVKRRPSSATLWDEIAAIEVLRHKGRVSSAIQQYRDLLAAYPDHPVILNNLALVLAESVDAQEAERLVRRAFQSAGAENYVEYLYDTLGVALLKQGHAVESIEHFRRALSMQETAERNLHMALALDKIGQPDAAQQYRDRAGALDTTGRLVGMK